MYLGFMSIRAPPAALKQKNYHNFPNMQPIISYFQGLFKLHEAALTSSLFGIYLCSRNVTFWLSFQNN